MTQLTLSTDQQLGYDRFLQFLANPADQVFVLEGYSGTGKTTLVSHILRDLPTLEKTLKLLSPNFKFDYEVVLSATTNKAAEALQSILHQEVRTIHSVLKLRVATNYKTGKSSLQPTSKERLSNTLLVVDEASFMDDQLLDLTLKGIDRSCKLLLIGDPAQLLNVNATETPAFNRGYTTAKLQQVVRQAKGNPIIDLSTKFRETVNTGHWFQFVPDGQAITHLPREQFEAYIAQDFSRPEWSHNESKVLAWTNRTVIAYNHGINNLLSGQPEFGKGDYAIVNSFIKNANASFKTDQTVLITDISNPSQELDVEGRFYTLDNRATFFMPNNLADKTKALAKAQAEDNMAASMRILDTWVDLRAAFACTINKSQGSTYDRVYIDLDDVKKCRDTNQLARLLYVGVSRARQQVFLTGDLV